MGDTSISWTHRPGTRGRSWNPTQGCALKSEGCRNCYAMRMARRFAGPGGWADGLVNIKTGKWSGETKFAGHKLAEPLWWHEPSTVFVDSMSDLFYEGFSNEQIAAVFGVMAACPKHTFIILTKRAKRMREWFEWAARHGDGQDLMRFAPSALLTCAWEACAGDVWGDIEPPGKLESIPSPDVFGTTWPLPNVWLGVSVENQDAADERIPDLLATPSEVRLLSCEPLIGQVDLSDRVGTWTDCTECGRGVKVDEDGCCTGCGLDAIHYGVDWVIAGCESGPGARPCDIAWVRSLRDQCAAASVPYFLKQAVGHNDGQFWELEVGGADIASIDAGPGSKSKPRGVIDLPYLDGVQHAAFPISPASSAEPRAVIEGK